MLNRRVSVAIAGVITTLITIDLLATRQILFFDNTWQTIIFILTIVVVAYGIGSLILLIYTRKMKIIQHIRKRNHFMNIIYFGVVVIQFSLLAILISIIAGNSIAVPIMLAYVWLLDL